MYISDLVPKHKDDCFIKYADDTCVIIKMSNLESCENRINGALNEIQTWAKENSMALNKDKTKFLKFGYSKHKGNLHNTIIDGIHECNELKILGVTIDSKLNWGEHVKNVVAKQYCRIHVLREISSYNITRQDLIKIYKACVNPLGTYCSSAFVGISDYQNEKLEIVLRRGHKVTCGDKCVDDDCVMKTTMTNIRKNFAIKQFCNIESTNGLLKDLVPGKMRHTNQYVSEKRRTNWRSGAFFVWTAKQLNNLSKRPQ